MKKYSAVNTHMERIVKLSSVSFLALMVYACGGSGQDDGSPSNFEQTITGLALDGNVARATVFLDTNDDGRLDSWEPKAFTDDQGYYSYNPKTNTHYCEFGADEEESQYCLQLRGNYESATIVIQDGYDVVTGEKFLGQMKRKFSNSGDAVMYDINVTPISSLLANAKSDADRDLLLGALGLTEDHLNYDYLDTDGEGTIDLDVWAIALKIHKVATVLAKPIEATHADLMDERGVNRDATSAIYRAMVDEFISSGASSFDAVLMETNAIVRIAQQAEQEYLALYETKDVQRPATSLQGEGNQLVQTRALRVPQLVQATDNLIRNNGSRQQVIGGARILESLVVKAAREGIQNLDVSFDGALNFINNPNNTALLNALKNGMSSASADVRLLSNNDFSGDDFDNEEEIELAGALPQDALPFTLIGGTQVRVADLDLGQAPNDLQDREVEFYFAGSPDALRGKLTACVKYIDEASVDGTLGEGNTRGELVTGYWSLLGATQDNFETFKLVLTLSYLEEEFQAIMKPGGSEFIQDQGKSFERLSFDFRDDGVSWYSENGISAITGNIPTTKEECKARLPSRIGI